MLRKTMHSKLKAGLAATFAAGLIFAVTSAQAKGIRSDHNHPTSTQQSSEHHRHHHKTKVTGPVHGPGSSHNPIVTKGDRHDDCARSSRRKRRSCHARSSRRRPRRTRSSVTAPSSWGQRTRCA